MGELKYDVKPFSRLAKGFHPSHKYYILYQLGVHSSSATGTFFVNSATTFLTHFETGKVLPHHVIMVKRFSSVKIGSSSTLYIRGMDNRAQDDSFLDDTTVEGRKDPPLLSHSLTTS